MFNRFTKRISHIIAIYFICAHDLVFGAEKISSTIQIQPGTIESELSLFSNRIQQDSHDVLSKLYLNIQLGQHPSDIPTGRPGLRSEMLDFPAGGLDLLRYETTDTLQIGGDIRPFQNFLGENTDDGHHQIRNYYTLSNLLKNYINSSNPDLFVDQQILDEILYIGHQRLMFKIYHYMTMDILLKDHYPATAPFSQTKFKMVRKGNKSVSLVSKVKMTKYFRHFKASKCSIPGTVEINMTYDLKKRLISYHYKYYIGNELRMVINEINAPLLDSTLSDCD